MTVRDANNGFKALVRKGTLCQEVFISTRKMELEGVRVSTTYPQATTSPFGVLTFCGRRHT